LMRIVGYKHTFLLDLSGNFRERTVG
jgi:hypothetical protein